LQSNTVRFLIIISLVIFFTGCKKSAVENPVVPPPQTVADTTPVYTKYSILKGNHFCDKSSVKIFSGDRVSFKVKFDSTAIYTTHNLNNQADINKLYGFSEGTDNHLNSARIGWSWNNNALHLYAYAYAAGKRASKEITSIAIGKEICCSIKISAHQYIFSANEKKVELPRALENTTVAGFWQYPYFGGDETAPHDVFIYIRDMKE
jgi:hypothetical protein